MISDLPVEQRLNIREMAIAVKRSVHTELSRCSFNMLFNLLNELGGECCEFGVDLFRCCNGKLGGGARRKGMTEHFECIIDCNRVHGGRIKALFFPAAQD